MPRQKILIVDDEAGMRELLNDLLADMGCDLFFAEDGTEGFEKAIEIRPDVVLLDIMLPGMDGFQICSALRKRPDVAAIPVIMLTGNNPEESARKGIEVGAEDVLSKPFNMSELKLRIKTVLQMNRYRLLATERNQFQWVVEHSEAGYIICDKNDRVTFLNSRAKSFLGIKDIDLSVQVKLFDLIGEVFERVPDTAWENWPELPDKSFLVRPETSITQAVWLRVELVPADDHAEQRIIRLEDVTEEMMMFQSMWQFEHMVSHKLRTPLTGLVGAIDALDSKRDCLDEEGKMYISEANEAANRLNDAVRGILEHLGSRKRSEEEMAPSTTFGSLENFANQLAATQGIDKIKVTMDPALQMYEMQLGKEDVIQIFQELYDNSIKFHPERKPAVLVDISKKDDHLVTMRVADNGKTLDAESLQKIGTPFYQAEKHFTGEIPGMGLGLSMISTMLTTLGGACRIRNVEGGPGVAIELDIPLVH